IMDFAAKRRLPGVHAYRELVEAGGLMSYGPSYADMHRRAASYVDRILKGSKPADLPVQAPVKFELGINLKAANALGLAIPAMLLGRADEVIDEIIATVHVVCCTAYVGSWHKARRPTRRIYVSFWGSGGSA